MDQTNFKEGNLISTSDAAKLTGYAKDYIGQLCRLQKIRGVMIGNRWLIDKESLLRFVEFVNLDVRDVAFQHSSNLGFSKAVISEIVPSSSLAKPTESVEVVEPPLPVNVIAEAVSSVKDFSLSVSLETSIPISISPAPAPSPISIPPLLTPTSDPIISVLPSAPAPTFIPTIASTPICSPLPVVEILSPKSQSLIEKISSQPVSNIPAAAEIDGHHPTADVGWCPSSTVEKKSPLRVSPSSLLSPYLPKLHSIPFKKISSLALSGVIIFGLVSFSRTEYPNIISKKLTAAFNTIGTGVSSGAENLSEALSPKKAIVALNRKASELISYAKVGFTTVGDETLSLVVSGARFSNSLSSTYETAVLSLTENSVNSFKVLGRGFSGIPSSLSSLASTAGSSLSNLGNSYLSLFSPKSHVAQNLKGLGHSLSDTTRAFTSSSLSLASNFTTAFSSALTSTIDSSSATLSSLFSTNVETLAASVWSSFTDTFTKAAESLAVGIYDTVNNTVDTIALGINNTVNNVIDKTSKTL
ncbi:MAG: helix-turn-helix domain-containing protein, partial [bacterium]|nr:helix-turn-helix domain-containing protein [bacterium]